MMKITALLFLGAFVLLPQSDALAEEKASKFMAEPSAAEASAVTDADMAKRMEAAVAYEKVTPIETNVMAMFDELRKLPQFGGENNEMLEKLISVYDIELVRNESMRLMAENFTVEEMEALTAFYSSPEGQSVYKKMPKFMADFMPVMQGEMQKAVMIGMQATMEKMNREMQSIQQQNGGAAAQ